MDKQAVLYMQDTRTAPGKPGIMRDQNKSGTGRL